MTMPRGADSRLRLGRWSCETVSSPQCPSRISVDASEQGTVLKVEGWVQPVGGKADNHYPHGGPASLDYQALVLEAQRMEAELIAMVDYARQNPRPIVFWLAANPHGRAMVIPRAASVTVDRYQLHGPKANGEWFENGIKFSLQLQRLGAESEVEFETSANCGMREHYYTLPIGAPSFRSGLWAPPAGADLVDLPADAGFSRTVSTCGGTGTATQRCFRELVRTATLPSGRVESRRWAADWEQDPAILQQGACTVWYQGIMGTGDIALGRWVPDHGAVIPLDWWEMENGLIRIRPWQDTLTGDGAVGFQIQGFWGGVWGPARTVRVFENGNGNPIRVWKDLRILRNEEEQTVIRLVGAMTADHLTDRRVTVDIGLQRGHRHLEFVGHYPDGTNNGFALRGTAGITSQTLYSVLAVRNSSSAGSWYFATITPDGITNWNLSTGVYSRGARRIRWGIGAVPPGFTAGGHEGWNNVERDYMSMVNTTVKAVR